MSRLHRAMSSELTCDWLGARGGPAEIAFAPPFPDSLIIRSLIARSLRTHSLAPRAFSLIEAMICLLLVSMLFFAAMSSVGAARVSQYKLSEQAIGQALADDLLAEILQQSYADPTTPGGFGREAGESSLSRADFDDVDDYTGWYESPPRNRNGSAIPGLAGWDRSVKVVWVQRDSLGSASVTDQGVKQIAVIARHNGVIVGTQNSYRGSAWSPGQ